MRLSPVPLHIPDGFLSLLVSILSWLVAITFLGIAVRRTQTTLKERQVPLMGIMAAFIFAAQMINFPVAGGTSGHLLGGALAAITLGPWAGMLVMTSVIGVQALLFQDGGLLALGANILNMGIITTLIGYGLYRIVVNRQLAARVTISGLAAWLSVMGAALLTSTQLWLSATSPAAVVFPAMLGVHALIGVGEALITAAAIAFVTQVRPDLIASQALEAHRGPAWVLVGVTISLAVVLLSPFASANPDGLERMAENLGFLTLGQQSPYQIIPDYTFPALGESGLSTILAGLVGLFIVSIAAYLIGRGLRRPRRQA